MGDLPSHQDEECNRDPMEALTGKRVFLKTFDCSYNYADSLRPMEILCRKGCTVVSEESAEVIIVNTCTVVKRTEQEVLRWIKRHADKELYVMGCMPVVQRDMVEAIGDLSILPPTIFRDHPAPLGVLINPAIGLVPIAMGCKGHCTYCIAQNARG